jgi:hypothetical protein
MVEGLDNSILNQELRHFMRGNKWHVAFTNPKQI